MELATFNIKALVSCGLVWFGFNIENAIPLKPLTHFFHILIRSIDVQQLSAKTN